LARRKGKGRPLDGILLLDKPAGITSNGALQQVKRLYGAAKAGHTGSLDPIATGVLPICFGEATKFSQYLLDSDKRYETTISLGAQTATGDREGEIVAKTPVPLLTEEVVERCLGRFRGEIHQTPSMYSAIKKDGQPLYKLARQGIEVEREARPVTIFELVLRGMGPETLDLGVHCSKGTYIRSLAEDIGTELGCGAHVAELRRTGVGQFSIEDAVSMDTVVGRSGDGPEGMDPLLLPIQEAVVNLPRVELSEHTGAYLLQGQPVQVSSAPKAGLVQLFHSLGTEERFIGIGEVLDDGKIAPRRLIAAQ